VVVALKILPPSVARYDDTALRRFQCEAKALASLQHPQIVSCYEGVTETEGLHYLVMEYVDGRDLSSLVRSGGPLPVRRALNCLLQAARGLQVAHAMGIFHRDIKPANLVLDREGKIRLLDFGLARVTLEDSWVNAGADPTATGAILGTIPYMSPEQATDSTRVDERSDIYSLGCTLHFLLTGRSPYQGRTWSEMFLAHRDAPIPSLRAARPTVPDDLDRLFTRMLAKAPADRPPSMASVIASIESIEAEARHRPSSSDTITVRVPDEPDDPVADPMFMLEDLKIDLPAVHRCREIYYTGKRLEPPVGPWDRRFLAGYLVLAGLSTLAMILFGELIFWAMRSG
jgi:serine/threonine protein kinase